MHDLGTIQRMNAKATEEARGKHANLEEVPEVVVEVPVIVDPVPEEIANTGTGDVVVGLLIGLALLAAGVVLFIKDRKNK